MNNKTKGSIQIGLTVLLIVAAAGVWYLAWDGMQETKTPTPEVSPTPAESPTPTTTESTTESEIDTSDWQTYRNEEYGFEFRYPEGFDVDTDNRDSLYALFQLRVEDSSRSYRTETGTTGVGYFALRIHEDDGFENIFQGPHPRTTEPDEVMPAQTIDQKALNGIEGVEVYGPGAGGHSYASFFHFKKDGYIWSMRLDPVAEGIITQEYLNKLIPPSSPNLSVDKNIYKAILESFSTFENVKRETVQRTPEGLSIYSNEEHGFAFEYPYSIEESDGGSELKVYTTETGGAGVVFEVESAQQFQFADRRYNAVLTFDEEENLLNLRRFHEQETEIFSCTEKYFDNSHLFGYLSKKDSQMPNSKVLFLVTDNGYVITITPEERFGVGREDSREHLLAAASLSFDNSELSDDALKILKSFRLVGDVKLRKPDCKLFYQPLEVDLTASYASEEHNLFFSYPGEYNASDISPPVQFESRVPGFAPFTFDIASIGSYEFDDVYTGVYRYNRQSNTWSRQLHSDGKTEEVEPTALELGKFTAYKLSRGETGHAVVEYVVPLPAKDKMLVFSYSFVVGDIAPEPPVEQIIATLQVL